MAEPPVVNSDGGVGLTTLLALRLHVVSSPLDTSLNVVIAGTFTARMSASCAATCYTSTYTVSSIGLLPANVLVRMRCVRPVS